MYAINRNIQKNAPLTETEIIIDQIKSFRNSAVYKNMISGLNYYNGKQDILNKQRWGIGRDGMLIVLDKLPNNKIVDNKYEGAINLKQSYLVGKPITYKSKLGVDYDNIFNAKFQLILNDLVYYILNCGVGYIYPYISNGELKFKVFDSSTIIPMYDNYDEENLTGFIRTIEIVENIAGYNTKAEIVEYYTINGMKKYKYQNTTLQFIEEIPYVTRGNKALSWGKIPLIQFKYNKENIPLISNVKSIQDAINTTISTFQDMLQQNLNNTILVLKDYDGTDLGEFRQNLNQFGSVKVMGSGDLSTLQIELNKENYESILGIFKQMFIKNAKMVDFDTLHAGQLTNLNIQSLFLELENDTQKIEMYTKSSLEELTYFVNVFTGKNDVIDFMFNKDQLFSETEVINNCRNSVGIISNETIVNNHPWVNNFEEELEKVKKEQETEIDKYLNTNEEA